MFSGEAGSIHRPFQIEIDRVGPRVGDGARHGDLSNLAGDQKRDGRLAVEGVFGQSGGFSRHRALSRERGP